MSNDLVKQGNHLVSVDKNAFEAFGEETAPSNIVGQLLKFSKGDWTIGRNGLEIPLGSEFVVNMESLLRGWVKWVNGKSENHVMTAVKDHKPKKERNELPDQDKNGWELGADGQPRDPWQDTRMVVMKYPGRPFDLQDNAFTFSTSSLGGRKAIGKLSEEYGHEIRGEHANDYPIVKIGFSWYQHPEKARGKIKEPTFEIVGWESCKLFEPGKPKVVVASKAPLGKKKRAA